jgi:hypothetical protein
MLKGLAAGQGVVVAGSVVDWGNAIENAFHQIIFLSTATSVRVERLREREIRERGNADPEFLEWAVGYDEGGLDMRSRATHERWLRRRQCPFIEIDGAQALERVEKLALEFVEHTKQ